MFDHEYTLVAHPRLRAKLSYRSDEGDLAAATVGVDYRRDDEWTEEGPTVELPEHPEEAAIEWQGFQIALYRDGERMLAREVSSSLLSDAVDALDAVETVAPSVVRKGKQAADSVANRATGNGPVKMTQLDGTTVEALRPPAQASFEVYEEKDEKWHWRLVHDNGNVLADSGQGYSTKRGAEDGLRSVKRNALGATVEPVGGETQRDVRSSSDAESDAETDTGTDAGTAES